MKAKREMEGEEGGKEGRKEAYPAINITPEAYITTYSEIRSQDRYSVATCTNKRQCCHVLKVQKEGGRKIEE